jgi:hypothetical protein
MLSQVFFDLRSFLFLFALLICFFAIFIIILVDYRDLQATYPHTGSFSYLLVALTSSIGQNDFDNYPG